MQDAMFNSMPGLRPLEASTALLHGHQQMLQQANCFWQRITELVDIIKIFKKISVCVSVHESRVTHAAVRVGSQHSPSALWLLRTEFRLPAAAAGTRF